MRRNCLGLLALPLLSGCLLINAFLGVAGLVGTGPIQYASSAYSVGEYAYQYAVNDKTPDEVIEENLAIFIGPFDDPDASAEATRLASAVSGGNAKTTETALGTEPPGSMPTPIKAPTAETAASAPAGPPHPAIVPAPAAPPIVLAGRAAPRRIVATRAAPGRSGRPTAPESAPPPSRTAIARPVPADIAPAAGKADPVLARIQRLERCLAEAERISLARPEGGLLLPAATDDAGRTVPEISGGWSIRHPVMSFGPDAG
ncbi:hypothetical protein [Pseudodesulfovibrio sp.]|uniref:hypothetical protein n=1 Tax=Pseudodesulfovibrio sp. TaxID=2035812 RepID=UPI0026207302|nr:hypothetical protein [Pseudodesulfovibrio sp.]MDD3311932.1 hypothetical protein [Pseudodesulfovibrio sp.]